MWKSCLLSGRLRTEIGVELKRLHDYADLVLSTTKTRLEKGPIQPRDVFAGYSIEKIVAELDQNTISDPDFGNEDDEEDEEDDGEDGDGDDSRTPLSSISRDPSTAAQFRTARERIGESFLKI